MEAAPPPLANARRQAKYSLRFLIYARHQKILLKKKRVFCLGSRSRTSRTAGAASIFARGQKFPPPNPLHFCPLAEERRKN